MKFATTTFALILLIQMAFAQNKEHAKLDSFFNILEENDRFYGSLSVIQSGNMVYNKSIGYADLENELHNNADTKFRIGSISKTFTAVLVMKAVEMGKLNLDDPLDAYFSSIKNANKITIRHLLNHRSGIKNFTDRAYFSWYTETQSRADLLNIIMDKGISFEAGTQFGYSNSNYVLLSLLLEKTMGESYPQLLEKYIIQPLNLKHTTYGGIIAPTKNEALSYRMKEEWKKETETNMSIPLGAGGIVSTPTDLCLFVEALFKGQLVSAQSLQQMKPIDKDAYGLGIEIISFDEMNGLGHQGDIDAFTSSLVYFEEQKLGIALISNGANYGKHKVLAASLKEFLGKPYDLPQFEFLKLSSEALNQYVGTYESDQLPMDLAISKKGDTLLAKGTGQPSFILSPVGQHKFLSVEIGLEVTFSPEEGKLSFEQQGMKFEMSLKKEEKSPGSSQLVEQDLDQYAGIYASEALPIDLTIRAEGDQLFGQGTGQSAFPLKSEGNHVFSNQEIGLKITFRPKEKKMNFAQQGMSFEMTIKAEEKPLEASKEDLTQYTGVYASEALPIDLTIRAEGDQLIGQGTGQSAFPLKSEGNHVFSNQEIGLKITFSPDEKKMQFVQAGSAFEMQMQDKNNN